MIAIGKALPARAVMLRLQALFLIVAGILARSAVAQPAGDITFAEFSGTPANTPVPSGEYDGGLPTGLAAMWNGWLLDTNGASTPMSVFVGANLPNQYDATIIFSQPVTVASLQALHPTGSGALYIVGRKNDQRVWSYTSAIYDRWLAVTNGSGQSIDQLAVEGKGNHLDDIAVSVVPPATVVTGGARAFHPIRGRDPRRRQRDEGVLVCLHRSGVSGGGRPPVDRRFLDEQASAVVGTGGVTNVFVDSNPGGQSEFYRLDATALPPDEMNCETERAINGLPTPRSDLNGLSSPT